MSSKFYRKAYEKYSEQEYEEALRLIREYIKQLRKKSFLYKDNADQFDHEINIKIFEARILQQLEQVDEANQIYQDLQQRLKSTAADTTAHHAEISYHQANIAGIRGDRDLQIQLLQQSKEQYEQMGNHKESVDIMFDLAEVMEFETGNTGRVDHYKEIIELNKSLEDKNLARLNSARARLEIGVLLKWLNPKVASQFLILAHKDFERLEQTELKYRSLVHLADLKSISELSRAIEILEKPIHEFDTSSHQLAIFRCKLGSYYLRAGEIDKAVEHLTLIQDEIYPSRIDLANALLEAAKSCILINERKDLLEAAISLASLATGIYDELGLKIGKAIGYLIEGIASYQIKNQTADTSKLQLIHFMARKVDNGHSHKVDPWVEEMIQYLAESDLDVYEITSKLSVYEDIPSMMQNAEILHLLGLYKLSHTDFENAQTLLDSSKSLYTKTSKKTGNYRDIAEHIDRVVAKSEITK